METYIQLLNGNALFVLNGLGGEVLSLREKAPDGVLNDYEARMIPGFSSYYASADGKIFNRQGRVISTKFNNCGYRQAKIKADDLKRKGTGVHRLVWSAFNGPIPKGMWINHKDGDKGNNHLSNLEVTTPSMNHIHARDVLKRRYAQGEEAGPSRLTEEGVEAVFELVKLGWSQHKIASAMGVSQPAISQILSGRTWKALSINSNL